MNCYKNFVTALVWIFVFVGTILILTVFTGDHLVFSDKRTYRNALTTVPEDLEFGFSRFSRNFNNIFQEEIDPPLILLADT